MFASALPVHRDTFMKLLFYLSFVTGLDFSACQISLRTAGTVLNRNQVAESKTLRAKSRFPNLPASLHSGQRMKTLFLKAACLLHRFPAPYPHWCPLDRLLTLLILKEPPSLSPCGCATATASGYLSPLHDQSRERRGEHENPDA